MTSRRSSAKRNAANARERIRMRVLARCFSDLKSALPWVPKDTKLSKLDTLKLASSYIAHLSRILDENQPEESIQCATVDTTRRFPYAVNNHNAATTATATATAASRFNTSPEQRPAPTVQHPLNLTWPYCYNSRSTNGLSKAKHPRQSPLIGIAAK